MKATNMRLKANKNIQIEKKRPQGTYSSSVKMVLVAKTAASKEMSPIRLLSRLRGHSTQHFTNKTNNSLQCRQSDFFLVFECASKMANVADIVVAKSANAA
jgi:hypothetical protein